uniref:Uncharacterized protein n=1 Tax=Knipowitschia caucasica TaxID=637954 RepID=A0AAV2LKR5_KNICA
MKDGEKMNKTSAVSILSIGVERAGGSSSSGARGYRAGCGRLGMGGWGMAAQGTEERAEAERLTSKAGRWWQSWLLI